MQGDPDLLLLVEVHCHPCGATGDEQEEQRLTSSRAASVTKALQVGGKEAVGGRRGRGGWHGGCG